MTRIRCACGCAPLSPLDSRACKPLPPWPRVIRGSILVRVFLTEILAQVREYVHRNVNGIPWRPDQPKAALFLAESYGGSRQGIHSTLPLNSKLFQLHLGLTILNAGQIVSDVQSCHSDPSAKGNMHGVNRSSSVRIFAESPSSLRVQVPRRYGQRMGKSSASRAATRGRRFRPSKAGRG